jgi:ELWxxDGT repeat protein
MRLFRLAALVLCATIAAAAPRQIPIADGALVTERSSSPGAFVRAGSLLFFVAADTSHGRELWRTDGTTAGTLLVQDLRPGIDSSSPLLGGSIGNAIIFIADDGNGRAIWRSDGTAAGTLRLAVLTGSAPSIVSAVAAGSRVFFLSSPDFQNTDIWVTDGTVAGSRLAGTFPLNQNVLPAGANGLLYFNGSDATVGPQLWVSDGTTAGTHVARRGMECTRSTCAPSPLKLFRLGTAMLATTETDLWRSDGTPAGTTLVKALARPGLLASNGNIAYVQLFNGETWRTDGTTDGTTRTAIAPDTVMRSTRVLDDGRLVWVTTSGPRSELWVSDGTAAGTLRAAFTSASNAPGEAILAVSGSRAYLALADQNLGTAIHGLELWLADVDAGTLTLLSDLDDRIGPNGPRAGNPLGGTLLGSQVVFRATTSRGTEPWTTDGTAAGTRLLRNIAEEGPAGALSGTVRDAATGAPVAGATVRVCTTGCDDQLITDSAGRYRFDGVQPGNVTLQAESPVHLSRQYNGGAPVAVADGLETTGLDLNLPRGGSISGRVVHARSGVPIPNVQVILAGETGAGVRFTGSGTGGRYRFDALPDGRYYVYTGEVFAAVIGQIYRDRDCTAGCPAATSGDPVSVTAGSETSGIDFLLHDFGRISGTVRDASTGAPAAGVSVSFTLTGTTDTAPFVNTDDQGRYTSPLLRPGAYYIIASATGYTKVRYPATPCPNVSCDPTAGTAVPLAADAGISGIDLSLRPSQGRLTGIVRGSDGNPLPGVRVGLFDTKGLFISSLGGFVETTATGQYVFPAVPAGTYFLQTTGELLGGGNCSTAPCDVTGATPVVLTEGQTKTVDMTSHARYLRIRGRVLDARTGRPVLNTIASVRAQSNGAILTSGTGNVTNGEYDLEILTRGTSVQISASASGYRDQSHPGTFTASASGVDIFLDPVGIISGTVTAGATGKPLANWDVHFLSTTGAQGNTFTDMAGHYDWRFANGTYFVYVAPQSSYGGQLYRDHDCGTAPCVPSAGERLVVPDGAAATGIDFHLPSLRPTVIQFSGRVVDDETGAPMPSVVVTTTGAGTFSGSTNQDGRYVITADAFHDIQAGDYRLVATPGSPYYSAWSGGGHCAGFSGTPCPEAGPSMTVAANAAPVVDFRVVRMHIFGVAPATGPIAGGTRVVITGDRFAGTPAVLFNGVAATVVSATATQIVALTPSATAPGAAHITVRLVPSGLSVTREHAFLYGPEAPANLPAATLAFVAPAAASSGVPFAVTVTALDAANDLAAGYQGTVTLTSSSGDVLAAPYTFTADDSGRHTFTVTMTAFGAQTLSAGDGTRTAARAIVVACAAPSISAASVPLPSLPASVCGSTDGNTASVPAAAGSSYAWSIANGTITSGQATNAITYTAGATGNVMLTLATLNAASSCTPSTYTATVPIRPAPAASLPPVVQACLGMPITVPVALSGTAPFRLVWSDGVEQSGLAGPTATRTINAPVAGTISIVSAGDASCTSTAGPSAPVAVNTVPQLVSNATDVSVRSGDSARLIAAIEPSSFVVSYRWYQGDPGDESHPVGTDSPTFDTPPVQSTLRYWVKATNACGTAIRQFTARIAVPPGRRRAGR